MSKDFVNHDEVENLIFKKKKFKPYYNLKKTDLFTLNLLSRFNRKYEEKITKHSYNLISTIFQDIYWQYSFNFLKYKNFIKKYGSQVPINPKKNEDLFNGYLRFQSFLFPKFSLKFKIKNHLKIYYLFFWAIFNFILGNKKKIIVSNEFLKNYRYNFFKKNINTKDILILNIKLTNTNSFFSKNINQAIVNNIYARTSYFNIWKFVLKLLKPSKIVLMDNLDKDYSILLASKLLNIETIGVTHGIVAKYHKWLYGYSFFKKKNILKFDKIYVADEIYKRTLIKYGSIYDSSQIRISGLLGKSYKEIKKKKSNKFVLYPYEFLTDFTIVLKTLSFLKKKGYQIVIKKRDDINNYNQFKYLNPIFVNDYKKYHLQNAFCIFGLSSSILYELVFSKIPIVSIKSSGLFLYEDIKLPNLLFFDDNNLKSIIRYKVKKVKPNPIRKKFIDEFSKR